MSLGLLVGRFGEFLEGQSVGLPDTPTGHEPHDDLIRIRQAYGHHIVALMMLSRIDGESVASEREVILRHLIARAKTKDIDLSETEKTALSDHLVEFRPSNAQLAPALKRMHRDSHDDIAALVAAAKDVVDADGVRRPREVEFLDQLARGLADL